MKQKAAIYIRVSTHWQVDKDSLSVQRRELMNYCELLLGITEYEVFEDPGYSAKNTDRPAYQQMMARLRTGEFSHLVVWKIDRISRNLLDFAEMYSELKKLGVIFVSKNEKFDTGSAIGEAMQKIILIFAELERGMTAERVTAVMLSRAGNGQWNGGRIPFGYSYDKETQTFSITQEEARIVNEIFSTYEELQSVAKTARTLNEKGYKTRKGNNLSTIGIHKIITNPFYVGDLRYNVRGAGAKKDSSEWIVVPDHHEPLISRDRFNHIQYVLQTNKRFPGKSGDTFSKKYTHVFAGLIRCDKCGSNFSATMDKRRADGWRPSLYGCYKRRNNNTCPNKYVSDVTVGPLVFNIVSNVLRANSIDWKKSDLQRLQKMLIKNTTATGVGDESLKMLMARLKQKTTGAEYRPADIFSPEVHDTLSERDILEDIIRKSDTAIKRLRSLYLYGDGMSEAEYIQEQQIIEKDAKAAERRLAELAASGNKDDTSLEKKASYMVMIKQLQVGVDYERFIRAVDPTVPKDFISSIIDHMIADDGNITSIYFKNGIHIDLTYN